MQKEFYELEIEAIPGATFAGTAEFDADDNPFCERIILHGAENYPELILTRQMPGLMGVVFSQIENELLRVFGELVADLVPGFDPVREYGTYRKGAL